MDNDDSNVKQLIGEITALVTALPPVILPFPIWIPIRHRSVSCLDARRSAERLSLITVFCGWTGAGPFEKRVAGMSR